MQLMSRKEFYDEYKNLSVEQLLEWLYEILCIHKRMKDFIDCLAWKSTEMIERLDKE